MYLFQCCECEKIAQNHVFFCEKFQPPCLPFFKHYIFGMFIFKYSYSVPFFKGLTSTESFFTELTQCSCTKEIALFFLFFYLFLLIFPKIRWDLFCWVSAILQHRPKEWFVNILGHFFVSYSRLPSWKQKKSLKRNNKKVVLYTSMLKWLLNPSYLSMIKIKQILNVKHSSTESLLHEQRKTHNLWNSIWLCMLWVLILCFSHIQITLKKLYQLKRSHYLCFCKWNMALKVLKRVKES